MIDALLSLTPAQQADYLRRLQQVEEQMQDQ